MWKFGVSLENRKSYWKGALIKVVTYNTEGVCAKELGFELKDGIVSNVRFTGGCPGNLQAISALIEGMPAEEVIQKVQGITCGNKTTSCTDQLANALREKLGK